MGSSEPARTIFKPQKCLHDVFPGPALSYNELEGVEAEGNLVMRWRRTLIVPRGAAMRRRRPDQLTGWAERAASSWSVGWPPREKLGVAFH